MPVMGPMEALARPQSPSLVHRPRSNAGLPRPSTPGFLRGTPLPCSGGNGTPRLCPPPAQTSAPHLRYQRHCPTPCLFLLEHANWPGGRHTLHPLACISPACTPHTLTPGMSPMACPVAWIPMGCPPPLWPVPGACWPMRRRSSSAAFSSLLCEVLMPLVASTLCVSLLRWASPSCLCPRLLPLQGVEGRGPPAGGRGGQRQRGRRRGRGAARARPGGAREGRQEERAVGGPGGPQEGGEAHPQGPPNRQVHWHSLQHPFRPDPHTPQGVPSQVPQREGGRVQP